ncbi:MAG: hypothetical protein HKL99_05520 [Burkholderiales bacterium]|jgi:hypothetical protein|nr:hypothetical protein [Burkholderiales bacterium]
MTALIVSEPMLARRQVRLAAVAALQAIPGLFVQSPGDWNTPPSNLPAALLRVSAERKDSVVQQMPEFTTSVTLDIDLRVQAATAEAAQDALEALGYQVEQALFTNYSLVGMLQQISGVDVDVEISSEGREHLGGARLRVNCELFEAFDPSAVAPALTPWPVVPPATVPLTSTGIHLDMDAPFDPSGTYTPSVDAPPYTPTPAPRTTGPDGRDEAALDITLPQ